jgi:hypothetical protein
MGNIRTIEDGYQYRIHNILNKLKKEIEASGSTLSMEDYFNTRNGKLDLAEALLDDIEQYCGLDEAIENEY